MAWMPYTAEDGSQQLSPGYLVGDHRATSDDTATVADGPGETGTDSSPATEPTGDGSGAGSADAPSPETTAPEGMEWLLVPKGSELLPGTNYLAPQTSGMHNDAPPANA